MSESDHLAISFCAVADAGCTDKNSGIFARAARPDICEAHDNVGWSVAMACIDVVCTLFQGLEGDLSSGGL